MKHLITVLVILVYSFTMTIFAHGEENVYAKGEVTFNDGAFYHKETNERINGIIKTDYRKGELKGKREIPIKNGLAHGVAKFYNQEGVLSKEWIYHEGKRNGIRVYNEDGSLRSDKKIEKKALSKEMIEKYSKASLPHPFAKKETEAVKKIQKAIESGEKPEYDENMTKEERFKGAIELFSKGFEKAGYNYFETIKRVADDIKNHPERIPPQGESRYKMIIQLMALQKSDCKYYKIDCLQFYPSETREAVQWLWENTGWSI